MLYKHEYTHMYMCIHVVTVYIPLNPLFDYNAYFDERYKSGIEI